MVITFSRRFALNRRFRAKLYNKIRDSRAQNFVPALRPLLGIKSRILKMDIDDTENPFGDGVGNRGVDDDDENIPLISTSSRRGSEDTTYHRTRGETSFV